MSINSDILAGKQGETPELNLHADDACSAKVAGQPDAIIDSKQASTSMNQQAIDEAYMMRALELAKRGAGFVNPNPMVGAVVVKNGIIIGEGWHTQYGKLHAEREALAACRFNGQDPTGATVYVTLEPCCHTGKTPPCTEALIEAQVARVVMGAPDPNPLVAGKGVQILRDAGIEVTEGVCVPECLAINKVFFHHIQTKLPYVTVKYAMTIDGKIATRTGKSKWITGEVARRRVHEDRNKNMAIMVGINTVLKDDPMLTCRLEDFEAADAQASNKQTGASLDAILGATLSEDAFEAQLEQELAADEAILEAEAADGEGANPVAVTAAIDSEAANDTADTLRSSNIPAPTTVAVADPAANGGNFLSIAPAVKTKNPIRVICDTHLRTPLSSQVVQTAYRVPTYIATAETSMKKQMPYREKDCEIITVATADGHLDLVDLMEKLGAMGIDSLIIEGGAQLIWSAFAFEIVNEVQAYIAPKVFGGKDALTPVAGLGVEAPAYAIELGEPRITMLGQDILLECEVK